MPTQQKDKTPTPCDIPGCGQICSGPIGLRTHKSWVHDPKSHAKRMRASRGNIKIASRTRHALNGVHPVSKKRKPSRRKSTRRVIRMKRKYTRRKKVATLQPHFQICPVCLSNIRAMEAAANFPIQTNV